MSPSCFFTIEFFVSVVAGVIAGNFLFWGVVVAFLELREWQERRRLNRERRQLDEDRKKGQQSE